MKKLKITLLYLFLFPSLVVFAQKTAPTQKTKSSTTKETTITLTKSKYFKIGSIEIMDQDLGIMTYDEAERNLEQGWRLPTKAELKLIYDNIDKLTGIKTTIYKAPNGQNVTNYLGSSYKDDACSSLNTYKEALFYGTIEDQPFGYSGRKYYYYFVRPVRDLQY